MTQFIFLQRKAREIGCSLTRGVLSGQRGGVKYYLALRNKRVMPFSNLIDVADQLDKEHYDWFWTTHLKNMDFSKKRR